MLEAQQAQHQKAEVKLARALELFRSAGELSVPFQDGPLGDEYQSVSAG